MYDSSEPRQNIFGVILKISVVSSKSSSFMESLSEFVKIPNDAVENELPELS